MVGLIKRPIGLVVDDARRNARDATQSNDAIALERHLGVDRVLVGDWRLAEVVQNPLEVIGVLAQRRASMLLDDLGIDPATQLVAQLALEGTTRNE